MKAMMKKLMVALNVMLISLSTALFAMDHRAENGARGGAPTRAEIHSWFVDESDDEVDGYGRPYRPGLCEDCCEFIGKVGECGCNLLFGCFNFCYTTAQVCCRCGKPVEAFWSWADIKKWVWQSIDDDKKR